MADLHSLTIVGFMATATMTTFFWLFSGLTRIDVDMVRAIGSLYTNSLSTAFVPGLIMHFTGGMLSTYLYGIFLNALAYERIYSYALAGMAFGFAHGVIVSTVLKFLLVEHHPIHRYTAIDGRIFGAHIAGHVIFGLVVGTLYGSFLL
jgi:hypothetical protein